MRTAGAKIKKQFGIPVGIGLANEIDTAMAMRTIIYANGAHEQDANSNLTLDSKQTLDTIKFVKALFQETMTDEVFTWDASSNNRAMIAGKISLALNAISITRTAEKENPEISAKIQLAKALKGTVRAIGLEHVMQCLCDLEVRREHRRGQDVPHRLHDNFRQAFVAGEFYDFPCWPKTVPDVNSSWRTTPRPTRPTSTKFWTTC